MKKLVSALLALAVVLSLMAGVAVTAGAEETYTYISDVYYSAEGEPKTLAAGQSLPQIMLKPSGEYTMEYFWLDAEEKELPVGTITQFGQTYCLRVKAYPKEGYAFEKDAWIGGGDEHYTVGTLGDGAAELWCDAYYTAWTGIEKVEITVAEPEVGRPLEAPVVAGAEANADRSFWVAYGEDEEHLEYGVLAKEGYIYQLFLNLDPEEGYIFTQDTQVVFNGEERSIYDPSSVSFYISYDLRSCLDTFAFDLAQLQIGQPFPQAVVAEGAGYTAKTTWTDLYTDTVMAQDAVAAENGLYQLNVVLSVDAYHTVAENVTLTVNGEEPEGHYYGSPYSGEVRYNQVFCFAQLLEKMEVTYPEPAVGEAPGAFSVPEGANYTIGEDTYWQNMDSYSDEVETFQKGNRYELNLYVTPKEGYAVTEDTQLYVNGELVTEKESSFDWTYLYYCTEYSFKTLIDKVELPAFPELKVGDPLPTAGGQGEGYTYEFQVEAWDDQGNELDGTTVVEDGIYTVRLVAEPEAGYEFAPDVKVTVGGKAPSKLCHIQLDEILETRVYAFGDQQIIQQLAINTVIPWIGLHKGGTVTLKDDTGLVLRDAMWCVSPDGTYENAERLTEPVQAGQHVLLMLVLTAEEGYVFSSDMKITVNAEEYPVVVGRGDAKAVAMILDLGEAAQPPDYNGLVPVGGVWGYYLDGIPQENYTGLVPYGEHVFYVENGILDFTYTGLVWYQDHWHYVENSLLTNGYTGLIYSDGNWFYAVDSRVDFTYTGLVAYEGSYFYVQSNLLNWSFTGMVNHKGEWFLVQNGKLRLDYTGLVCFDDTWLYVEQGHLGWDYTGLVEHAGNRFYVQGSVLDWSFTGLGSHDGGWYFIQNALLQKDYNGLVYFDGTWFYIENGQLTWQTNGLRAHDGKLFYITNSMVDWSYTGEAEYDGTTYQVVNGVAQQ